MVARKKSKNPQKPIESYAHKDKQRVNNPQAGLVTPQTDPDRGEKKVYAYDPHLDPCLQWAGKAEHGSFEVPTVSLHVHERIDPKSIIEAVTKVPDDKGQASLFDAPPSPLREAIDFYQHQAGWSNRLVAGDSLLVMNSLLEKEGLAGKVQMVYIDPPYGIKYGSNFQPFTNKREVKDGKDEGLTKEPETIKAFRDTWELGIHSYLTYMRDRLLLAREMLTESGSCFVQIGDENVHRISEVMDEVFGANNRLATISFATTSGSSATGLPQVADYLLWYAKDEKKAKYHQLYEPLTRAEVVDYFNWHVMLELADGSCRKLTNEERFDPDKNLPDGARIYRRAGLDSQGVSTTGRSEPYEWNGQVFPCSVNRHWSVSSEGMDRLAELGRLEALEGQASLMWKKYEDEVPGRRINNIWSAQMYPSDKKYVVETSVKAIQRCLLMTTDPGDLVFDPTCGSGSTAYVAEQWGRRWITCDTSRVALTLAKQRLMTATFDYYTLAHPAEGVGSGFAYQTVNKVTPKILAYNEPPATETLYDQPYKDRQKKRVSGPFTVEAVPAPAVQSLDDTLPNTSLNTPLNRPLNAPQPADAAIARCGETLRQSEWRGELERTGLRGKAGQIIHLGSVEALPAYRYLHAKAETRPSQAKIVDGKIVDGVGDALQGGVQDAEAAYNPQRMVVSFGPQHAPLEQRQVEQAIQEAQNLKPTPELVVFAAFQFDPEAAKDIDQTNWPGVTLLKAQMNADLLTDDLRKKRSSNESFWLVGQPDVQVETIAAGDHVGKIRVSVQGFDYYNTNTNTVESGSEKNIAMWMLDTDYDGRSLYPRQVFFPMASEKAGKDGWSRLARNLRAEIDEDLIEAYRGSVSLPFEAGEYNRVAVKIVDDRGIESLRIIDVVQTETI